MERKESNISQAVTNNYGIQWNWGITILNCDSDTIYSCVGNLEIPLYGSRSGYGRGKTPEIAIEEAMKNSLTLFPAREQTVHKVPPMQRQVLTEKASPATYEEKAAELKNVYNIKTKLEFVAFTQVWNKNISSFEMIDENVMNQLHEYVDKNPKEFESFIIRA